MKPKDVKIPEHYAVADRLLIQAAIDALEESGKDTADQIPCYGWVKQLSKDESSQLSFWDLCDSILTLFNHRKVLEMIMVDGKNEFIRFHPKNL